MTLTRQGNAQLQHEQDSQVFFEHELNDELEALSSHGNLNDVLPITKSTRKQFLELCAEDIGQLDLEDLANLFYGDKEEQSTIIAKIVESTKDHQRNKAL